jgi:hypothetical protein
MSASSFAAPMAASFVPNQTRTTQSWPTSAGAVRALARPLLTASTTPAAGSYGNRPEPIPFLRILAVSDREDLRGEHRPLT